MPLPLLSDLLPLMLLYFTSVCYLSFADWSYKGFKCQWPSWVDTVIIDLNQSFTVLLPRNSNSHLKQDRKVLDPQTLLYVLDFTEVTSGTAHRIPPHPRQPIVVQWDHFPRGYVWHCDPVLVGMFAGSAVQAIDVPLTCTLILFWGNSTNWSVEDLRMKI